jgi:hypothetical protein
MKPHDTPPRPLPTRMVYRAPKLSAPPTLDGDWDKPVWHPAPVAVLENYMGERPAHFPHTEFRVAYDMEAIYIIFRTADRYVRAVAEKEFDGPVYKDSCVEFFFTPGPDTNIGYFNLEMNCGGTLLFHCQTRPRQSNTISIADCARITKFHQLPRIVNPEITTPTVWTVEYRLPLEIISRYMPKMTAPKPGVLWRANFYKCGDDTSHPHWLTWAPVDFPRPDFHRPESFGWLEFV